MSEFACLSVTYGKSINKKLCNSLTEERGVTAKIARKVINNPYMYVTYMMHRH